MPKELMALMSALRDGQEPDPSDNSRIIYRFRQPVSQHASLTLLLSHFLALLLSIYTHRHTQTVSFLHSAEVATLEVSENQ